MPYVKWSCKGCTERSIGCHSTCEKYISEQKLNEELKAKDRKNKTLNVYASIRKIVVSDAASKKAKRSLGYKYMGW